jgi:rsbT co-antagonist protein RsbR
MEKVEMEAISINKYLYLLNSMENFAAIINTEGRVEFANKVPIEQLGYKEEDVMGKYLWEISWYGGSETVQGKVKKATEEALNGKRTKFEIPICPKDGPAIPVIFNGGPLKDDEGNIIGAVAEGKGIREQKKLEEQLKDTVEKLKASHEELSTPIIQIWKEILALPIIGVVDSYRAQKMMETLLNKIVEMQTDLIIIDVTGVASIDTEVASIIIKTVQAANLLGARCVLTGIRPEVAQTMIYLGLDFEKFVTKRDMQEGLRFGIEKMGYEIRRKDSHTAD